MPCTSPVECYPPAPSAAKASKIAPGEATQSNRAHVYSASRSYNGARGYLRPCGQCKSCRLSKVRDMSIRITHEAAMHEANCFGTLTYSAEHLPADLSVSKDELQRFLKRLRWNLSLKGVQIRFFSCGEYGDQFSRPHYHFILFGYDFSEDRKLFGASPAGATMFTSAELSAAWPYGLATLSDFSHKAAQYVAGYAMKKVHGKLALDKYLRFDGETGETWQVEPEFVLMSRMPGLGRSWFERFGGDCFPSDFVTINGRKRPVPGYYLKLYEVTHPNEARAIRAKRSAQLLERIGEQGERRLMTKHEAADLRAASRIPRGEGMP